MGFLRRFFEVRPGGDQDEEGAGRSLRDRLMDLLRRYEKTHATRKLSHELSEDLQLIEDHMQQWKRKKELLEQLMHSASPERMDALREILGRIKGIVRQEFDDEKHETGCTLRAVRSLEKALSDENLPEVHDDEIDLRRSLQLLKSEIESLLPHLKYQLGFLSESYERQLLLLPELIKTVEQEGRILGIEKDTADELADKMDRLQIDSIVNSPD